jgi:hypothetical protein
MTISISLSSPLVKLAVIKTLSATQKGCAVVLKSPALKIKLALMGGASILKLLLPNNLLRLPESSFRRKNTKKQFLSLKK